MTTQIRAIDRITQHFNSLERRSLKVPELGRDDEPFVIWWKPWTVNERRKLHEKASDGGPDIFNHVLIDKVEDEAGNKLFTLADLPKLRLASHAPMVARIANAILQDGEPPAEQ